MATREQLIKYVEKLAAIETPIANNPNWKARPTSYADVKNRLTGAYNTTMESILDSETPYQDSSVTRPTKAPLMPAPGGNSRIPLRVTGEPALGASARSGRPVPHMLAPSFSGPYTSALPPPITRDTTPIIGSAYPMQLPTSPPKYPSVPISQVPYGTARSGASLASSRASWYNDAPQPAQPMFSSNIPGQQPTTIVGPGALAAYAKAKNNPAQSVAQAIPAQAAPIPAQAAPIRAAPVQAVPPTATVQAPAAPVRTGPSPYQRILQQRQQAASNIGDREAIRSFQLGAGVSDKDATGTVGPRTYAAWRAQQQNNRPSGVASTVNTPAPQAQAPVVQRPQLRSMPQPMV